jgi:ApaG protein
MYSAVTDSIRVTVTPLFLDHESAPDEHSFVWAYTVDITNLGDVTVQLMSRHWVIIDGNGRKQEVQGPGVIGQQPHIYPSQSFTYTSACPLSTPSGMMSGSYEMVKEGVDIFKVLIPPFSLDSSYQVKVAH